MPHGASVHHPLFARFYAQLAAHEPPQLSEHRQRMLAGCRGRVLEVGAGTGANFEHYPPEVTEVLAVEPEPYLRERAEDAARRAGVPITVVDGTAEQVPAPDASFDVVVTCLVLCSVADQGVALREARRVLRPGGELRFYEHVLSRKPALARVQHVVDRTFWPHAFGGCHTARDTGAAIAQAGFDVEAEERMWVAPLFVAAPAGTHLLGRARKTG